MGKKSPPPKPPDLTPISDAQLEIAEQSNELAREFLGMSRDQFAWMQENAQEELALAREHADRTFGLQEQAFASDEDARKFAREVGQTQIDAMELQQDYARRDRERYENTFLPMQDRFIAEAEAYDTPERREAEAARQMADVQRQVEAQRTNADARLQSMGIDPSQIRSSSLMNQISVGSAANQAMVGNQARQQIEDRGRALRADAMNMGMGLPMQAAAGFQGSNASGAGAVNAGQAGQQAQLGAIGAGVGLAGTGLGFRSQALSNVAQLTGSPMQWASMGQGGLGQASGIYGQAAGTMSQNYTNQMSHWKAGQEQAQNNFNNVMSVASMAGGMMMAEGGVVQDTNSPGYWAQVKAGWEKKRERAREQSPYIAQGKGSGEGGALTLMDRFDNSATAGRQWGALADNPWENSWQQRNTLAMPGQQGYAAGGPVRGAIPTRQSRDTIQASLTEGEYVVPRDVVQAKGIEFFDKLVNKYHREGS